jgi:hypothetical protein
MTRRPQRLWRAFAASAVLAVLCLVSPPSRPGYADDKTEARDRIKTLLRARVDTLKEILDTFVAAQARGGASLDDVLDARAALLKAQLDLGETKEERLKLLEQFVKEARDREQATRKSVQSGGSPPIDGMKATLARIDAELALEREKAGK